MGMYLCFIRKTDPFDPGTPWGVRSFHLFRGIKSNRCVYGHSFMHPSRIKVSHPDTYVQQLRKAFVLVDGKERRERVEDEIETAAKGLGGKVLTDGALVDTVNNLVEYPVAVAGAFEEAFLELPREILITAMREHQKYFALTDENENLMTVFYCNEQYRCKKQGSLWKRVTKE